LNRKVRSIATDFDVKTTLKELMKTCNLIKNELLETPCEVKPHLTLKAYIEKIVKDSVFHATLPSVLNYLTIPPT